MPAHTDVRLVPYSPEQLFDLVADVARYPDFLPWCQAARVWGRQGNQFLAELKIGFGPFKERYTSRITLERPTLITASYVEGPFKTLSNSWRFQPVAGGTEVRFHVDFEFRSRLLGRTLGLAFDEGVRRMVRAFTERARAIYGPPALR
ncbi:type II toxin-antitoxin system RatA family toxin [Formicincola oecophyllae]|uniref:Type II toxin-antitoxin system RatA family toxin n=1 Tax=Formicincola oecophyllae TaxID=2558361 RepID=A0A4Y6UBZ5_9PROT|nr:type II toxin-antitoxin system RatA family toxin [Formicincola oecophyllae]QDH13996.1 type II toxin-antitoxin system RatA family toxin [Formicincola oecophyllae]